MAFSDRLWPLFDSRKSKALLVVFALLASIVVWSNAEAAPARAADFAGVRFKVLSPDGTKTLGSTRFTVLRNDLTEEIRGETRYLDGERDSEDERLYLTKPTSTPRLDTYEHSFFNADGTLHMVDVLDAKYGVASCTSYASDGVKVRKARLEVPADSFAGASALITVVAGLRRGVREISFHAFARVPGPGIFSVKASLPLGREHWRMYPGYLVRLDMRPDLGALGFLLSPFMPKMDAWFSPDDDWNYVGGEFDRYFRGPHVLAVLVPSAN